MAALAAMCAEYEITAYGSGQPLYELVKAFGEVTPLNTLDSALQSFEEAKQGLKPGDTAFSYSDEYERFSLAMKVPDGGIVFAGLLHDENGTPRVDETLHLCWVKATKNFELNGDTIIQKGHEFIKVLPESYLTKITKAA